MNMIFGKKRFPKSFDLHRENFSAPLWSLVREFSLLLKTEGKYLRQDLVGRTGFIEKKISKKEKRIDNEANLNAMLSQYHYGDFLKRYCCQSGYLATFTIFLSKQLDFYGSDAPITSMHNDDFNRNYISLEEQSFTQHRSFRFYCKLADADPDPKHYFDLKLDLHHEFKANHLKLTPSISFTAHTQKSLDTLESLLKIKSEKLMVPKSSLLDHSFKLAFKSSLEPAKTVKKPIDSLDCSSSISKEYSDLSGADVSTKKIITSLA